MAAVRSSAVLCLFVILFLIAVFTDLGCEARGGRGGGRFGGRYGSRVRYSSGTRVRVRTGARVRYGFRNSGMRWQAAAAAGYLYGYTRYQSRRSYYSHPHREPTICVNQFDYKMSNGSYFMYFICPMADQPDSYTYCCGPETRQRCCRFQDDAGRVAGVVIGVLIFAGIIALIVYCCCFKRKTKTPGEVTAVYKAEPLKPMPPPTGPTPNYPQPDGATYPLQPGMDPNGYPPQPVGPPGYLPQPEYPPQPYPQPDGYPPQQGYPPQHGYPPQPGFPPADGGMYPPGPPEDMNGPAPPYPGGPPPQPYPGGPPPQPYPGGPPPQPYPGHQEPYPPGPPYMEGHYQPPDFNYKKQPAGRESDA